MFCCRCASADEGLLEPELAAKLMQQAGELYAKSAASKDGQFFSQAALAASKLLRAQLALEAESKRPGEFQGLSAADTIAKCVISGNLKAANGLKNDFKVSDKHFCWIRLRALAARRDWEGVVALADENKPPIGCGRAVWTCACACTARPYDCATAVRNGWRTGWRRLEEVNAHCNCGAGCACVCAFSRDRYMPFVEVAFDEKAPKHELGKLIAKLPGKGPSWPLARNARLPVAVDRRRGAEWGLLGSCPLRRAEREGGVVHAGWADDAGAAGWARGQQRAFVGVVPRSDCCSPSCAQRWRSSTARGTSCRQTILRIYYFASSQANQSFTRQAQGLLKNTMERLGAAGAGGSGT